MQLHKARVLATEVIALFHPYCERLHVAGSIRRNCSVVNDIEIVCVPRWEDRPQVSFSQPLSLFEGEPQAMVKVNLLHEAMMKQTRESSIAIDWIKPGTSVIEPWPIKADGKYWRGLVAGADGNETQLIKLDVFIARPENYGVIFAIRTGSADFSRALVTYARDMTPYRVHEGYLIDEQQIGRPKIICPDELSLFELLGLRYVAPEFRRLASDVRKRL